MRWVLLMIQYGAYTDSLHGPLSSLCTARVCKHGGGEGHSNIHRVGHSNIHRVGHSNYHCHAFLFLLIVLHSELVCLVLSLNGHPSLPLCSVHVHRHSEVQFRCAADCCKVGARLAQGTRDDVDGLATVNGFSGKAL